MDHLTCVIDARTLVDRIHEIKQWVYSDAIGIHIPLSSTFILLSLFGLHAENLKAFEKFEELYQTSLVTKEVQKESAPKRASSKSTRKETPLFDINPRTAREFLLRTQGANINNISFQLPHEQFTQWREEEQQANKVENLPEGPPTSFAEALRRKKFNDELEANGTKGSSKPKLVARSSSPKSPWKYHKVPIIASSEISQAAKPLFSCMLWRLHEFENNPLMPETFVLLSNDNDTRIIAQKLGIPTKNTYEISQALKFEKAGKDNRVTVGELENDFPQMTSAEEGLENECRHQHAPAFAPPDGFDFAVAAFPQQDEEIEELKEPTSNDRFTEEASVTVATSVDLASNEVPNPTEETVTSSVLKPLLTPEITPAAVLDSNIDELELEINQLLADNGAEMKESLSSQKKDIGLAEPSEQIEYVAFPLTFSQSTHHEKKEDVIDIKEESDDDEEVVVFKPKSKRFSGSNRFSAEPSRPKTADSITETSESHTLLSPFKPHIITQLKPQSPVFVPKCEQGHVNSYSQPPKKATVHATDAASIPLQKPTPPPIQQQKRVHKPQNIRSEGLAQRQSREIIERQREVINRQVKSPAKPPPRKIQMQPTSSPTVIDPDAFDRSYVVQSPSIATTGTSGNHRVQGGRGGPRHAPKTPEPDFEFVLKSGSPRGSARGRERSPEMGAAFDLSQEEPSSLLCVGNEASRKFSQNAFRVFIALYELLLQIPRWRSLGSKPAWSFKQSTNVTVGNSSI
ncbi:hypothetical protein MMC26_005345 [Xylographa opegraphella]|nr:hypothetical protein [Xylographa opegraphella]